MHRPSTPLRARPGRALPVALLAAAALTLAGCAGDAATSPTDVALARQRGGTAGEATTAQRPGGDLDDADDERGDDHGGGRAWKIKDATGDFIPSYAGPRTPDLDVHRAEVLYDGGSFLFTSKLRGDVGQTPGALYVWGVKRDGHDR